MNTLPDAVRLADWVDSYRTRKATVLEDVATELRRLHKENENLKKAANRGGHMTIAWNEIERLNEVNQMLVESAEMALEVMSKEPESFTLWVEDMRQAREALRQALAQPVDAVNMSQERVDEMAKDEHEPVAWMYVNTDGECEQIEYGEPFDDPSVTPLYTAPPKREWVGLTEEEMSALWVEYHGDNCIADGRIPKYEKAIEAKLKEKNT